MLLRTSKQDGSLWPVSYHVTVRPVASKVHPTDNLARDPNDTRKKASTTKNELCSFTRRPRRVSQGWQKMRNMWLSLLMRFSTRLRKLSQKYKLESFFKPESPSKHMLRAMAREWCNWSQKRWTGRQTNEVYEKTRKSNFWVTTSIKWTFLQDPQTQKN